MCVQVPEAKHITWTTTSWRACPYNCSPSDSYLQVTCEAKVRDLPPLLSVCVASHRLCTAVPTKKINLHQTFPHLLELRPEDDQKCQRPGRALTWGRWASVPPERWSWGPQASQGTPGSSGPLVCLDDVTRSHLRNYLANISLLRWAFPLQPPGAPPAGTRVGATVFELG